MRKFVIGASLVAASAGVASAGGLFLPGAGTVSTSRAGAGTVSSNDGEAIAENPSGLANAGSGTLVTVGAVAFDYVMQFTRAGTYDVVDQPAGQSVSYAGDPYPTMKNEAKPPLGIGAYQPVPVISIVSDLGQKDGKMHLAFGIYAPNAYPFRKMDTVDGQHWAFDPAHFDAKPPPTRYDILEQEAAVILPSLAFAYRVTPDLDVGVRLSTGIANLKSTVALWGVPSNYEEFVKQDGIITLDAKDSFLPAGGLGATYRVSPNLEIGANYTSEIDIHAKGTAVSTNGPLVTLGTATPVVIPVPDDLSRCEKGGTQSALKACVDITLPMTAQLGARYKLLDGAGKQKGDIELDLDWENWSAGTDYRVVVDGEVVTTANMDPAGGIQLKDNLVRHGLQDTYGARLGGSYMIPMGNVARGDGITVRGGVGYDTAAAQTGWERADLDGAARTTVAAGASYQTGNTKIDLGFGVILEGTRTQDRGCNPTSANPGCGGTGSDQPINKRQGPDPITPIIDTENQTESPVNQGTFKSHYVMFMLGVSQRF